MPKNSHATVTRGVNDGAYSARARVDARLCRYMILSVAGTAAIYI